MCHMFQNDKAMEGKILAYRDQLVCAFKNNAPNLLRSYKYDPKRAAFIDQLASKTELATKRQWHIEDMKLVTDDWSGITTPFILASDSSQSHNTSEKRFCVFRATTGSNVLNLSSKNHTSSSVKLVTFFEFSCTLPMTTSYFCSFAYGPRVLIVYNNRLGTFAKNFLEKNTETSEYTICDTLPPEAPGSDESKMDCEFQMNSKILSVMSEQTWIVTLLLVSGKDFSSIVVIALEQTDKSSNFERITLNTRDFLPQEYAPKVSSLTVHTCHRTETKKNLFKYNSACAVGLNDGYVMVFVSGVMQVCVTLWTFIDARYPGSSVIELTWFSADVVICHTDTKDCFVVNRSANKVVHHWNEVNKAVVGDFLQSGGRQLLLLFDRGSPSTECLLSPDRYLLTDLQGWVVDRRQGEEEPLSQESGQEGERSENLQRVVAALQEQNQTLGRSVAEEERRLAAKQQFVTQTLRHLHTLSLSVPASVLDLAAPEVPLLPLLGSAGVAGGDGSGGRTASPPDTCPGVQVQSVWHRLVDYRCVIGVKVLNTSARELKNCTLVLTTPSTPHFTPHHHLSAQTTTWQSFPTTPTSHPLASHSIAHQPNKRHKTAVQLRVHRTTTIQPSESVTLTCAFDASNLGAYGEVEYSAQLVYSVSLPACDGQTDVEMQQTSVVVDKDSSDRGGERNTGEAGGGVSCRPTPACRRMSVSCGRIVVKASEVLQGEKAMSALMSGADSIAGDLQDFDPTLEEDFLALSAIQHGWCFNVSFTLHEATTLQTCLTQAGFVYHPGLGQYFLATSTCRALHLVRVQLLGYLPLPERAAKTVMFTRDHNQLLLLLRHLYTHLPDDASITLATVHHTDSHLQGLMSALSTLLSERKGQARKLVNAQKNTVGGHTRAPALDTEEENDSRQISSLQREREQFLERQKQYRQSQEGCVSGEEVARFASAVNQCQMETDMAMAYLTF